MGKLLKSAIIVFIVIGCAIVYNAYFGARHKGEYAASVSALRNMQAHARQFYETHNNSFSGFCVDQSYLMEKQKIESIKRTGLLNQKPYEVKCIADNTAYAISMTSYIDFFGKTTPETHLCVTEGIEILIKQNHHVDSAGCDE